jgi:hypothetical protein
VHQEKGSEKANQKQEAERLPKKNNTKKTKRKNIKG